MPSSDCQVEDRTECDMITKEKKKLAQQWTWTTINQVHFHIVSHKSLFKTRKTFLCCGLSCRSWFFCRSVYARPQNNYIGPIPWLHLILYAGIDIVFLPDWWQFCSRLTFLQLSRSKQNWNGLQNQQIVPKITCTYVQFKEFRVKLSNALYVDFLMDKILFVVLLSRQNLTARTGEEKKSVRRPRRHRNFFISYFTFSPLAFLYQGGKKLLIC